MSRFTDPYTAILAGHAIPIPDLSGKRGTEAATMDGLRQENRTLREAIRNALMMSSVRQKDATLSRALERVEGDGE